MHAKGIVTPGTTTSWLGRMWLHRYTPWVCFIFAALLFLPMTNLGLSLDDYVHYDVIAGGKVLPSTGSRLFSLFTFFDGDVDRTRMMIEHLAMPWWTDDNIKINFFRPLSAFTQILDYQLWPESNELKHLHSLVWYLLLIIAVYFLFSKIFSQQSLALFATFIFTVDFSHFLNVSWIAGRNALIAALFSVITIFLYHHWRSKKSQWAAFCAPLCFFVGLLSGEMAIATGAYLLSYALFLDDGSLLKRFIRLIPYGLIFITWWYAYRSLGFGSSNSGFYLDPANYPAEFVLALLYRVPTLLFAEWSGLSTLIFQKTLPEQTKIVFVFTLLFLLITAWVLWPLLKTNAKARFWLLGSTLAVIPSASTIPHERVLLLADIGGTALLAQLLFSWSGKISWRKPDRIKSVFLALLFFMHLVFQPFIYMFAAATILTTDNEKMLRLSTDLSYENINTEDHFFYVNQPNTFFFSNLILSRSYHDLPIAKHNYVLGSRHGPMELFRIDEHSMRITMKQGIAPEIINGNLALIFRQLENGLKIGDSFSRGQCQYTVEAVTSYIGFPKQFIFSCKETLENSQYRWLAYQDDKTMPWTPPSIGKSVTLNLNSDEMR